MSDFKIEIHIPCHNEAPLIKATFQHYKTRFPSATFFIHDNYSTDSSIQIAKELGCFVTTWGKKNEFDVNDLTFLQNNVWKNESAHWVINCDMDEWVCITEEQLKEEDSFGTTIIRTNGYNMIGESNCEDLSDINDNKIYQIEKAVHNGFYSKRLIFNAREIGNLNSTTGQHICNPSGKSIESKHTYVLKHMDFLGKKYKVKKNRYAYSRSENNRKQNFCWHHLKNDFLIEQMYDEYLTLSSNLDEKRVHSELEIQYGLNTKFIYVTSKLQKLRIGDIFYIPAGDVKRSIHFNEDPCFGEVKQIKILNSFTCNEIQLQTDQCAYLCKKTNQVYIISSLNDFSFLPTFVLNVISEDELAQHRLDYIHANLRIRYGNYNEYRLFQEEYPEQLLSARFIKGNERILEIGGNIGRNSLVMSYILKNSRLGQNNNSLLVTLECSTEIAKHLKVNKDINSLDFFVEECAISKRKLIQKDWDVHEFDHELLDLPIGFSIVPTINLQYLREKYGVFDTLILDCEGSFYGILRDFPEILDGINLIIMENDYQDLQNKIFIDSVLFQRNFKVKYEEKGGWGPCKEFFYQVWERED